MALTTEAKAKVIKKYQKCVNDCGSTEVQLALLTANISSLTDHLKINKKDIHSRSRGLIKMINSRRKLLSYLKNKDELKYLKLIKSLGLRK